MGLKRALKNRYPLAARLFGIRTRFRTAFSYFTEPLTQLLLWLFRSNEVANFTYNLTPLNKSHLISLIASVTGKEYQEISAYVAELESDAELRRHIRDITVSGKQVSYTDLEAKYGRRLGWYAIVRATKPRVVVETGVDRGLGSCVLTSALIRNETEGYPGYYYGTDINPDAGSLFSGRYARYGEVLYGDSITSLQKLGKKIDLFINDSDHSAEYEEKEYLTVSGNLSPDAVILGDNSHNSDRLLLFALATGRRFVFFREAPANHWYPGAGIGIAFREKTSGIQNASH